MFHYTKAVSVPLEEALTKLEESLKSEKFGVLWQFDIKEKLQEKGVEFNKKFIVLEVCNPHEAKRVLEEESLAGYFLPCKIVVYEENGQTNIGMLKPTALIAMLENNALKEIAKDIENRLIGCIDAVG
ncbi:DUF302 domain-containing protein [Bacillus aerolatus]|uniref:DUF302 domain-containing protein n=1 Tax=Bacillus aerolatus TaxID=2653354 RepID=A0A6I1FHE1_9BACI|nr:DUF302 domain-containing protein [Bacillus aerolatus]KAB7705401.1 DUF302 domain-containing protein [Bacillus aerolatus]